ncbi:MAG: glycosyltransferase [Rhizobiales bacterium]|nr:glycosyltransferase [Hyphomicrobiales bacterium]
MAVGDRAFGRIAKPVEPPGRGRAARRARSLSSIVSGFLGLSRPNNNDPARHREPSPAVELDCLKNVFAPDVLRAAERRGLDIGIGADQVLIRWGAISEEQYLRFFARHTGLNFETLAELDRSDCLLHDDELPNAACHGILPIEYRGKRNFIFAPTGYTARRIARLIARYPSVADRTRVTTQARLREFLTNHTDNTLGRLASDGLAEKFFDLSAAPIPVWRSPFMSFMRLATRYLFFTALFAIAPGFTFDATSIVLAFWFLLFTSLRLAGSFAPRKRSKRLPHLSDNQLPVYTVVAALYREAKSVRALMRSIDALDYPREKLDIKIVIEPNDLQTRAAISKLGPLPHVQVLIAPDVGPRTKPKALNYALQFARGTFITIFDAEDRPEPNQLRKALDTFRSHHDDVACAQASLCIDNTSDSWLARMFTAEYAGQFDVFLQGFSTFEMPLPLGGSSNHFRTSVLRECGGWDAYNVTEDADLGFRLARFGYRSVMFQSTTYEEAPARFEAWLRQRSRWMKGWMQTWSVHMRSPLQLWRDTGARGFFTLSIVVGGNVLTALAHPILLSEVALQSIMAIFDSDTPSFLQSQFAGLHIATIAAGYLSTVVVGLHGLSRRGLLHEAWVLALTPIYWIFLSLAAWRALIQLLHEPYRWEKTEHGLARSSRISSRMAAKAARADRVPFRGIA